MSSIHEFWCNGNISKGCNASFITLVPKKQDPSLLNDYRSISLIGSYYKIIAKLLSNRIRKVIPTLVGFEQSAFIKGRNIIDGALIANESISFLKHNRIKSLIFKVDFEKEFDCLNWDILMEVMEIMVFGVKWRGWIRSCLSSASISVLVNGTPTSEFKMEKGIRQGDPLSPFLFIIVAEGLNVLAKKAVCNKKFLGVEIGSEKVPISHLQYADDMIFFGEWSITNLQNLFKLLKCFELTSGLKVNYQKSNLFGISVEKSEIKNLANMFGCNSGNYIDDLGIPFPNSFIQKIGDGMSTSFWNDIWVGNMSLKNRFKRLSYLEQDLDAKNTYGRAGSELAELQQLLFSVPVSPDRPDWWYWDMSSKGVFTSKILSDLIDEKLFHSNGSFSSGTIRKSLIPKKVEVFVWRVLKGRIPVLVELDKRGVDLHSVRCPICDNDIESICHSLLTCEKVRNVWHKIFDWWSVRRPPNLDLRSLLSVNSWHINSDLGKHMWQAVTWTCIYHLWKNRNEKVFKNKDWTVPVAVCEIQVKSFEWVARRNWAYRVFCFEGRLRNCKDGFNGKTNMKLKFANMSMEGISNHQTSLSLHQHVKRLEA
ncbi:uncharacterized protein [Rutidosis leptorrhynchoides]|uniref:uncharacterized protein n=1 Tax=Rutidosis leptorrhynchoides TaxID=125765 RepID=UPI003A993A9B